MVETILDKFAVPALLMIVAAVLGVGGREWIARARSGTKRMAAEDDAQVSVLAEVRAEKVGAVLREAKLLQTIDELRQKLAEAEKRLTVVSMLSAADPASPVQVTLDSAFLDLNRPLRPRLPARAQERPADLFQATDPFAPPPAAQPRTPRPDAPLRMLDPDEYAPAKSKP